ncbi:MAG: hypothetical protein QW478_12295 [Candidatus Micrarchaeaceae archaeon]
MATIKKSDMKKNNMLRDSSSFKTFPVRTFSFKTTEEVLNNGEQFFNYLIEEINKDLFYNNLDILRKIEKNKDYSNLKTFLVATGIGILIMYNKNKITTKDLSKHLQVIEDIYTDSIQSLLYDLANKKIYNHFSKEKDYGSYIR